MNLNNKTDRVFDLLLVYTLLAKKRKRKKKVTLSDSSYSDFWTQMVTYSIYQQGFEEKVSC